MTAEPGEGAEGGPADGRSVAAALADSLARVDVTKADAAVVELARRYATEIDANADNLVKFGPKLLSALTELRLTPKARMAVVRGGADGDSDGRDDVGQQQRAALAALQADHGPRED